MNHALNNWMDKAEGKPEGSSNRGINKERERQGYKAVHEKRKEVAGKMSKPERAIDRANREAKPFKSMFEGRDYLGTKKGSKAYKGEFNYGKKGKESLNIPRGDP